jgi:hypothetical protein
MGWRLKERAFWHYPLHHWTGAPSFAFFAKGGIVKSHPPTESRLVPWKTWVFRPRPGARRNPGLKSETWATLSIPREMYGGAIKRRKARTHLHGADAQQK